MSHRIDARNQAYISQEQKAFLIAEPSLQFPHYALRWLLKTQLAWETLEESQMHSCLFQIKKILERVLNLILYFVLQK